MAYYAVDKNADPMNSDFIFSLVMEKSYLQCLLLSVHAIKTFHYDLTQRETRNSSENLKNTNFGIHQIMKH